MLAAVLAAVACGEVAPTEAARIARRACARLRAVRRLARKAGEVRRKPGITRRAAAKRMAGCAALHPPYGLA
jgi:hypothetical protein